MQGGFFHLCGVRHPRYSLSNFPRGADTVSFKDMECMKVHNITADGHPDHHLFQ